MTTHTFSNLYTETDEFPAHQNVIHEKQTEGNANRTNWIETQRFQREFNSEYLCYPTRVTWFSANSSAIMIGVGSAFSKWNCKQTGVRKKMVARLLIF